MSNITEQLDRKFKEKALKFIVDKLDINSKVQLANGETNVEPGEKIADIFFPKAGIFTLEIPADDSFDFVRDLAHELVHVKQIEEHRLKLINPGIVEFEGQKYDISNFSEDFEEDENDLPFDKEANREEKILANEFWNHVNLNEQIIKKSFLKDILSLDEVIEMTSANDVRDISEWLHKTVGQIIWQYKELPPSVFESQVLEMINNFHESPNDKRRIEAIFKLIKSGQKPQPVFVEAGDPSHFIMEGRHRIVAFFLLKMPVIPVIFCA